MSTSFNTLDTLTEMFRISKRTTKEIEPLLCSSILDLISKSQLLAQCFATPEIMASLSKMVPFTSGSLILERNSTLIPCNSLQSLQLLVLNTSSTLFKWTTGSISSLRAQLERELCRGLVPLNDITPRSSYVELSLRIPSILIGGQTSTTTTTPEMCSDMESSCIKLMETDLLRGVRALKDQISCQQYFLNANYQSLIPPQVLLSAMKMSSVVDLSHLTLKNTRLLLKLSPFLGGTSVSYTSMIKAYATCARRDEQCLKRRLSVKQKRQERGSFDAKNVITLGGKLYRYKVVVLKCEDQDDDLRDFDDFCEQVEYTFDAVPHCWKELVVRKQFARARAVWDLTEIGNEQLIHVKSQNEEVTMQRTQASWDLSQIECDADVEPPLVEKIFSRSWLKQTSRHSGNKLQQVSKLLKQEGLFGLKSTPFGVESVKIGDKWLNFREFGKSTVFFVYTPYNIHLATTRQRESCDYIQKKYQSVKWIGVRPEKDEITKVMAWSISVKKLKNENVYVTPMMCRQGKIAHDETDYLDLSVLDSFVDCTYGPTCVQKIKKFLAEYYQMRDANISLTNYMTPVTTKDRELVFELCDCPNHQFYVAQFNNHVTLGLGRQDGMVFSEEIPTHAKIFAVGFATSQTKLETHYYSEMRRNYQPWHFQQFVAYNQQGERVDDVDLAEYQEVGEEDYVLDNQAQGVQLLPINHHPADVEDQAFPDFLSDGEEEVHPDEENWAQPVIDLSDSEASLPTSRSSSPMDYLLFDALLPVPSPFGFYQGVRLADLCIADEDFDCDCPRCRGVYIYQPTRPRHYQPFEDVRSFYRLIFGDEEDEAFCEIGPFFKMCEFQLLYAGQSYNIFYGIEPRIYLLDLMIPCAHMLQLLHRGQLEDVPLPNQFQKCLNQLRMDMRDPEYPTFIWPAPYFNNRGEWNDIFDGMEFETAGYGFMQGAVNMYKCVQYLYAMFLSSRKPLERLYQRLQSDCLVQRMLHSNTHMKYLYVALLHSERTLELALDLEMADHSELAFLASLGSLDAPIVAPCYQTHCHHGRPNNWNRMMADVYHYITLDQLVGLTYQQKRLHILRRTQEYYEFEEDFLSPVQLLLRPLYCFGAVREPTLQPVQGVFHQPTMKMFNTCVMPDVMMKLKRPRASVMDCFGILADYFRRPMTYRYYRVAEFSGVERTQEFTDMTTLPPSTNWWSDGSALYSYHEYAVVKRVEPRAKVYSDLQSSLPPEVIENIRRFLPNRINAGLMNYVNNNCDFVNTDLEFCISGRGFVMGTSYRTRDKVIAYKTNLFIVRYMSRPLLYITPEPIFLDTFTFEIATCLTGDFCLDFEPAKGENVFGVYFTNGKRHGCEWETLPRFGVNCLSTPKVHAHFSPFDNLREVFFMKPRVRLVAMHSQLSSLERPAEVIPRTITTTLLPYYSSKNFQGLRAPKIVLSGTVATHFCKLSHRLTKCVLITKLAVARVFHFTPTVIGSHYHLDPMEGMSYGKRATIQFEPAGLIKDVNILVYQFGDHVAIHYFPESPTYVAEGKYPSKFLGIWLGYLPSEEECFIAQQNGRVYVPTILRTSRTSEFHIRQNALFGRGEITVTYHYAKNFQTRSLTPMFVMFKKVFEKSKQDLITSFNVMGDEAKHVLTLFCQEFDKAYTLQTLSDEVSFESSAYPDLVACALAYTIGYELCLTVVTNAKRERLDIGSSLEKVFVDYNTKTNTWELSPEEDESDPENLDLPFDQYYEFKVGKASVVLVQEDFKEVFDFLKSEQGVDYVVNPANSQLRHGGGIAKVISCMCGPKLTTWSNSYIKQHKKLAVTSAVKSPSFQLGKKVQIIHVVGPQKSDSDVALKLSQSWKSVFSFVKAQGTVLTSMLSTGIFGCSVLDSVNTLLATLVSLDKNVVVFVVTNMLEQYNQALAAIKGYQDAHGLPNFGNTCWFNALYQLLKSFAAREQIVVDLLNCFDDFYECPTSQCVEWVCEQINVEYGKQHDAVEMLMKIFDVFKCDARVGFDCLARLQQVNLGSCVEVPADAVLMFTGKDQSGHWTAARKINGTWYTFNDNVVTMKEPVWSSVVLVLRDRGLFKSHDYEMPRSRRRRVSHRVPRDVVSQDVITYIEEPRFASGTRLSRYCVESVESFVFDVSDSLTTDIASSISSIQPLPDVCEEVQAESLQEGNVVQSDDGQEQVESETTEQHSMLTQVESQVSQIESQFGNESFQFIFENKIEQVCEVQAKADLDVNTFEPKEYNCYNIAVVGEIGSGKSSFINTILGFSPEDEGSAEVGCVETTQQPTSYRHPTIKNLVMWDMPGIERMDKNDFQFYDAFVIVSDNIFNSYLVDLVKFVRSLKKWFVFVRTKTEVSLESDLRFKPSWTIDRAFDLLKDNYNQIGIKNNCVVDVKFVENYKPNKYDFVVVNNLLQRFCQKEDVCPEVEIEDMGSDNEDQSLSPDDVVDAAPCSLDQQGTCTIVQTCVPVEPTIQEAITIEAETCTTVTQCVVEEPDDVNEEDVVDESLSVSVFTEQDYEQKPRSFAVVGVAESGKSSVINQIKRKDKFAPLSVEKDWYYNGRIPRKYDCEELDAVLWEFPPLDIQTKSASDDSLLRVVFGKFKKQDYQKVEYSIDEYVEETNLGGMPHILLIVNGFEPALSKVFSLARERNIKVAIVATGVDKMADGYDTFRAHAKACIAGLKLQQTYLERTIVTNEPEADERGNLFIENGAYPLFCVSTLPEHVDDYDMPRLRGYIKELQCGLYETTATPEGTLVDPNNAPRNSVNVRVGNAYRKRTIVTPKDSAKPDEPDNQVYWNEVFCYQYIGFKCDFMGLAQKTKARLMCYALFLWFGILYCTSHDTPFYYRFCIYTFLLWLSNMIWNARKLDLNVGWSYSTGEGIVLKVLSNIKLPSFMRFNCDFIQWLALKLLFYSFCIYDSLVKVSVSVFQMPQLRCFTWPLIRLGFVDTFLSHHILAFPSQVANQSNLPVSGDVRHYVYVPLWCKESFRTLVDRAKELTSTGRSKTLDNWYYQCCSKTSKPLSCFNVRDFVFDSDCKNHKQYGFLSSLSMYLLFYSGFVTFWLPLFCFYYMLFMWTFKNLPVDTTKPIKWTVLQQVVGDLLTLITKPLFGRPACPPFNSYLIATTAEEAVRTSRSLLGRFCTPVGFQQPVMNVENGVTVSNLGLFNPLMWPLLVVVLLDNRFIWFFNVLSYIMMPVFVIVLVYFYLRKICGCINIKGVNKCCTKHFNQFSKPLVAAGVHGNRTNFTYQPMQEHWCDRHSWYCPKEEHYMTPDMAVYIKNYYSLATAPTADTVWCDYVKTTPNMTWANFKFSTYKPNETIMCGTASHADSMLMAWYALLHGVRFVVNPSVMDIPPTVSPIYVSSDSEDSTTDKVCDVNLRPNKAKGKFKKQSVAYFAREPVDLWYYVTLIISMGAVFMFMYSCFMVGQYVVMPRDKFFGVNPTGYSYLNAQPFLHASPPVLQNSDGMVLATQLRVPSITYSVYRLLSGHLYFTKLIVNDNECTPPFGAARLSHEFTCNDFTYVLPAHIRFFNRYVMLIHPDQLHMLPFEVEHSSHTRICYTTGANSVDCLPTFEIISPYVFVLIVVIFTVIFLFLIRMYIVMYSYFKVFTYMVFKLLFVNTVMVLFVVCLPPLVPGVVFVLALWLCDSVMFLLYLAVLSLFILPWFYVMFFMLMVGGFVFWWMMRSADVVHLTPDGLTFNGTFEQISKCVFPLNPLIVNRLLLDCQMSHSDLVEKSKFKTTEGKLATEMMKVFMTGETAYYQPSNFSFQSMFAKVTSPFTLHVSPPMPMFRLYVHFNGPYVGSTCTGTGFAIDDNTIVTAKHLFEYENLTPTYVSAEIVSRSHSAMTSTLIWKEPTVTSWKFEGENAYITVENLRDFYGTDFKYLPFQQIEKDFYKRMEPVTIHSIKYGSEFATQAWQTVNGHFVCYNTEGGDSGAPLVWNGRVIGVHQGLCDSFKTTLASDFKGEMMTEVKGHHVDPPVYYKPVIISAAYNKFVAGGESGIGDCKNYHHIENDDFACMHSELEKVSFGDQMRKYCQSLPQYLEPLQYFHVPSFWQPFKKQSVSSNVLWVVENLHFIFSVYFLICDFVAYWWLDDPFSVVLPLFFIVQLLSTVFLKNVLFWTTSYLITLAVTFYVHSEVAESMYLLGLFSDRIVNRVGLILAVSVMCLFVVVRVVVNVKRAIFVFLISVVLIFLNVMFGVVQFKSFVALCLFDVYAVFAALLTPQPVVAIMMLILFDTKLLMSFAFVVIVLSFRFFKDYRFVRILHNFCNFDFVLTQVSLFRYRHRHQGNDPTHFEAMWLFLRELYYGMQDVKYEVFSPQAGTYNVKFLTDMIEQDQLEAVEQVQRRLQRFSIVQDKTSPRLVLYSKCVEFLRDQIQQQRAVGANPFIISTVTAKDINLDSVEVHNPLQFKPEDMQAHMWFYSKSPVFVGQVPIPTNVQIAAVLDTTYNCQDLTADEKNNVAATLQIQNAAITLSLFEKCTQFLENEIGEVPTLMWQSEEVTDIKQLEAQIENLRNVLNGMKMGTSEYKATRKQLNICQSQLDQARAFERKLAKFLEKVDQQQAITNETAKQLSAFKNLVKQVYESYMSSLKVRVVESNDASCLLTSIDLPRKLVLMRPITGLDNIKIVEKANGCEITAFGNTFNTGLGSNLAGLAYSSTQPLSAYPFIFNLEGIFKQQANIGYKTVECNMSSDNGNVLYKGKIVAVPSEDNPDFVVCGKGYKLDCGINVLMIPSIVRYITLNLTDQLQRQSLKPRRRLQYKPQGVRLGGVNLGEHQAFSNELISSVGYTTWVSSTVCTDKTHKHPWFVQIPSNEKDPDWFMHNTQIKNNQWVVDAKPTHWLVDADTNDQLFALALTDEEYLKAESILAKWSPITQDVECWFKDLKGYYTVSGLQPLWPVCPKKICNLKIVPIFQPQSVAYADEPTHFLSLPVVNKNFLEAFYELQEGFPGKKQVAPHISLTMLKLTDDEVAKVEDILDEMVLPNTHVTITTPHMMGQHYVCEVDGLQAIHDEVVSVLRQHGIACDQTRLWKPHLTIGEIKDGSVFNKFKDFGITCKLEDCDFVKLGAPKANARYEFIATLPVGDLNC